MYQKIESYAINSIVYPGNLGGKTRFKDIEISPILSFIGHDHKTYHIFKQPDWHQTRIFIVIEFQKGIVYEPMEISEEFFKRIKNLIN